MVSKIPSKKYHRVVHQSYNAENLTVFVTSLLVSMFRLAGHVSRFLNFYRSTWDEFLAENSLGQE